MLYLMAEPSIAEGEDNVEHRSRVASTLVEAALSEIGNSKAAQRFRVAATEVFASKGYGAATTREIAAHLELSPGSLYPHYKTKESLLYAITLEGHAASLECVARAAVVDESPVMRLRTTMAAYTEWHARNHELARVVQYELHALDRPHFRTIARLRTATTSLIETIIGNGCRAGDFDLDTEDVSTVSLAINSLAIDVSRWFPSNTHSDPVRLGHHYGTLAARLAGG
jgi:AcrR family transcriptional regulator